VTQRDALGEYRERRAPVDGRTWRPLYEARLDSG